MTLLIVVAAFAFFMWWITGHFIPAAFMAFCSGGLIVLIGALALLVNHDANLVQALTHDNMPVLWGLLAVSFGPRFIAVTIHRGREVRRIEALHGVSLAQSFQRPRS